MSYIKRTLFNTIERTSKTFPILLLTAPHQVEKTTSGHTNSSLVDKHHG